MGKIIFSHKLFNPNFWHLREAMRNEDLRYIFMRGGSSSGKSVSVAQAALIALVGNNESAIVLKKVGSGMEMTIYEEFKVQARRLQIYDMLIFTQNQIEVKGASGKIDFSGLDNPEKIKGINNYKRVIMEELTDFDYEDWTQITFRLRGKSGLQIIGMFNPITETHWINEKIYKKQVWSDVPNHLDGKIKDVISGKTLPVEFSTVDGKRINQSTPVLNVRTGEYDDYPPDTMEIKSTYQNNFWVVGSPCGSYGYYDKQTIANYDKYRINDYNFYRIYALGEWGTIKTGGEFLHAFENGKHTGMFRYVSGLPIHVSIDYNVLPYASVSFFQCDLSDENHIRAYQIHEICAGEPINTASASGEEAANYLHKIGYKDVVYIYGDYSTKNANGIDDQKRSYADKFIDKIEERFHVRDLISKNTSVSMSGEFVNDILSEDSSISLRIDESCVNSIRDYENAKKDTNGCILKKRTTNKLTGQSYEEFGHLTDCLRYFVCEVFKEQYIKFSNKRKRNEYKKNDVECYDIIPEPRKKIAFCFPDVNGKFIAFCISVSNKCDVSDIVFSSEYVDSSEYIKKTSPDYTIFECEKPYFFIVRELRELFSDVRCSTPKGNPLIRISAHQEQIKERFRFEAGYESKTECSEFINNMLDFNGKDSYEALYTLSYACSHVMRYYFC